MRLKRIIMIIMIQPLQHMTVTVLMWLFVCIHFPIQWFEKVLLNVTPQWDTLHTSTPTHTPPHTHAYTLTRHFISQGPECQKCLAAVPSG